MFAVSNYTMPQGLFSQCTVLVPVCCCLVWSVLVQILYIMPFHLPFTLWISLPTLLGNIMAVPHSVWAIQSRSHLAFSVGMWLSCSAPQQTYNCLDESQAVNFVVVETHRSLFVFSVQMEHSLMEKRLVKYFHFVFFFCFSCLYLKASVEKGR